MKSGESNYSRVYDENKATAPTMTPEEPVVVMPLFAHRTIPSNIGAAAKRGDRDEGPRIDKLAFNYIENRVKSELSTINKKPKRRKSR